MGLYLLHGNEQYMIDFLVDYIKNHYLDEGLVDLNFNEVSIADSTAASLMEMAETLPVFSPVRVLIVNDCDFTKDGMGKYKAHYDALSDFVDRMPEDLLFLLISPNTKVFQGKFVKKVNGLNRIVPMEKLNEGELIHFIRTESKKKEKTLTESALRMIVRRSEYITDDDKNLYSIVNALDTILGVVASEIGEEVVDTFLQEPVTERIFAMLDAISRRDTEECLRLYYLLRLEDQNVHQIFYMIIQHIRDLIRVKGYEHRPSGGAGFRVLKMRDFVYNKHKTNVKKFSFHQLYGMMRTLYDVSYQMRDTHADEDALMTWMLADLCQA